MQPKVLALGLGAALGLAGLAGCGSDASSGATATTVANPTTAAAPTATTATAPTTTLATAFPITVKTAGGEVTIDQKPTKIVSLSPTATEMLFAIGAGSQVVAVDDQSNYPPEAPKTALSGFTPNLEAIVGYEPDLVTLSDDTGDLVAGLQAAGVPAMVLPAAKVLDDTYAQLEQLGAATGNVGGAGEVVSGMKTDIEALQAKIPARATPATYYHELDDTYYTATSKTFIGALYALAGLTNIADAVDTAATGYPQLSAEYILQANPNLIFLADTKCCGQNATTVAARPGWSALQAVEDGGVVGLDDDIASRWGPRVVDLLTTIVEATAKVPAAAG